MSEVADVLYRRLEPEDQARADFYALLARLFSDAPDAKLLAGIGRAASLSPAKSSDATIDVGSQLAAAWDALRAASAMEDAEAASSEYQAMFVGVGRSEVSLYGSHYLGPQSGRPLAEVRAALAELGLARRPDSSEFEDHFAVLLEAMRMLVAGDGERPPAEIARQHAFFKSHVAPWAFDCCTAIAQSPVANYYRRVAQFAGCFLALERDSLAMD